MSARQEQKKKSKGKTKGKNKPGDTTYSNHFEHSIFLKLKILFQHKDTSYKSSSFSFPIPADKSCAPFYWEVDYLPSSNEEVSARIKGEGTFKTIINVNMTMDLIGKNYLLTAKMAIVIFNSLLDANQKTVNLRL